MSEYSLTDVMKKRAAWQILFSAASYVGANEAAQTLLQDLAMDILMGLRKDQQQLGVMQLWTLQLKALDSALVGRHWNLYRVAKMAEATNG